MRFIVRVGRQDDGAWIARCPSLPECEGTGATREEALANVEEVIQSTAQARTAPEMPPTIEVEEEES